MEKKKNDQVGDDAHGGREDLGPADRPQRPHDETYEDCGDCVVQTHCQHWGRCLATCVPIDLAPMHCHHCANMAKRNQWLEQSYARELERQTVMTQNIIAAARQSIHDDQFGVKAGSATVPQQEQADSPRRSAAQKSD